MLCDVLEAAIGANSGKKAGCRACRPCACAYARHVWFILALSTFDAKNPKLVALNMQSHFVLLFVKDNTGEAQTWR